MTIKKTLATCSPGKEECFSYEFLKVSEELHNYIGKILDYPGGRPCEERGR